MTGGELLEREAELALMAESLDGARRGDGRVLLVEGAAGIGKTVLLAEARRLATDSGASVLAASGGELESDFPYGIVRQLFEPIVGDLSAADRAEVLAGAAGLAGAVVGGASAGPGGLNSPAVMHGLYWLTANLAARAPRLIAVDDVHWSDSVSLRFLLYLARRLEGVAVLLLLAVRTGDPTHEPDLLARLGANPLTRRLRPAALSERAVARLVEPVLGAPDERFVGACRAATGGTPFLVRELVDALAADGVRPTGDAAARVQDLGPATVAHATLLRLARLPTAAVPFARAVAVLGQGAGMHLAARLAGVSQADAATAVDALEAAQILAPVRPLHFVHPIVRTAVYGEIAAGSRAIAHARAATLLASDGADPDAVAGHLLLTEPAADEAVVAHLRIAAGRALARGAPEHAAAYLRRALDEGVEQEVRFGLLRELASSESATMQQPGALEHLRQARTLATDPVQRAGVACELATVMVSAGRWEQALELLEAALGEVGERDPGVALRLTTTWATGAAYDPSRVSEFEARIPALRATVERGGSAARALALLLASRAAQRGEPRDDVLALVERGLDGGRFLADEGSDHFAFPQGSSALVFVDALDEAERLAEAAIEDARARGSLYGFASATSQHCAASARRGDLIGAEADTRLALELVHEHGLLFAVPSILWAGAEAIVERPGLADVADLAETLELPPDFLATMSGAILLHVRGRLRLLRRDRVAATDDLRRCGRTMEELGYRNPSGYAAWRSTLAGALATEDAGEALRLAHGELADARRIGLPRAIGVALRTAGVIERGERGLTHLHEAVRVLDASPARLEHARALVELGAALRRANRRTEAREPLRAGLDRARSCGAIRLAEHAHAELVAAGAKPRREAVSGVESLTPSERRIARMAATGMSNPEIAQALFVTRRTVETHLSHIYAKLDISGRAELAGAKVQ